MNEQAQVEILIGERAVKALEAIETILRNGHVSVREHHEGRTDFHMRLLQQMELTNHLLRRLADAEEVRNRHLERHEQRLSENTNAIKEIEQHFEAKPEPPKNGRRKKSVVVTRVKKRR